MSPIKLISLFLMLMAGVVFTFVVLWLDRIGYLGTLRGFLITVAVIIPLIAQFAYAYQLWQRVAEDDT
jgi:hypothetical protein